MIDTELVFDFASRQLQALVQSQPDAFPMVTEGGKWKIGGESWTNWCEGFLGGQLWLLMNIPAIHPGALRQSIIRV